MDRSLYAKMAAVEDHHWWFVARRLIVAKMIARLGLPPRAEILEAGCGTGGNLPMLAAYGQVYAIEIDEGAAVLARARGVGAVQTGGVPDALGFGDKLFDLILLLDVLEHLDADQGALHSLAARLKDGGWLMLTVPAYPFLWSHHDERNHHKRRYTMRGLLGVVRKAGYNVRFASYFNCWLFPMVALVRLLQGRVFGSPWENLNLPPSLLNTALTRIFASERYALSRHASLPFGVSLLLVAQKPQV